MFKLALVSLIILTSLASIFGSETYCFSSQYENTLRNRFFEEGKLSQKIVSEYIELIQSKRNEIYKLSVNDRIAIRGQSKKKAVKKAKEDVEDYDLILKYLKELKTESDEKKIFTLIDRIKSMEFALKFEGKPNSLAEAKEALSAIFSEYKVTRPKDPTKQAKNLIDPKTGKILSGLDLISLQNDEGDFSRLNPPMDNPFIEHVEKISEVDVVDRFLNGKNRLYRDHNILWPRENIFRFDKIRKTQSKPKIDVKYTDPVTGEKETFKIKLSREIYSEPTVASLANAVGIYTDISRSIKNIKIYLGDTSYGDFVKEWYSYFSDYEIESLVKEHSRDDNGEYIVFTDGLLEQRFKEFKGYNRVGGWGWGENDHKDRREVRGLFVFQLWVGNVDLKESGNNKLINRVIDGNIEQYKIVHDMGMSLGNFLQEKPLNFKWKVVKKKNKKKVQFDFKNFQYNTGFDHVTWDDARWMIRKIAQLSRKQIEDALSIGGWPKKVKEILVEKLISRRNDLVENFELIGDVYQGNKIEILPVYRDHLVTDLPRHFEGHSVDFRKEFRYMLDTSIDAITQAAVSGVSAGIGAISKLSIDAEKLGFKKEIISDIILRIKRTVTKNPNPAGEYDLYLVGDTLTVGFRLGYGYTISGEASYEKSYKLIRPARTKMDARYMDNFFINLALPFKDRLKKLRPNEILIESNTLATRGRVRFSTSGLDVMDQFGIGVEGTLTNYNLGRKIYAKTPKSFIYYVDKSDLNEKRAKIFAKALVKLPIYEGINGKGDLERKGYQFDLEGLSYQIYLRILEDIEKGRIDQDPHVKFVDDYKVSELKLGFLGLAGIKSKKRIDRIDDQVTGENIQRFDFSKADYWNVGFAGEEHEENIFMLTRDTVNGPKYSVLRLDYVSDDKDVRTDEFNEDYLRFVNSFGARKLEIPFTTDYHVINNSLGKMKISTSIEIYESGIDKLFNLTEKDFLKFEKSFSSTIKEKVKIVKGHNRRKSRRITSKVFSFKGYEYDYHKYKKSVRKFLKKIKKHDKNSNKGAESLIKGLFSAIRRSGGSFSPVVLHRILSLLDKEDYYAVVIMTPPKDFENKLPNRMSFVSHEGEKKEVQDLLYLVDLNEMKDVYLHFNR